MKKRITYLTSLKSILTSCFFSACTLLTAQSSNPPQAVADNVFVSPGAIAVWNILSNDNPGECSKDELTVSILSLPQHIQGTAQVTGNRIRYLAPNNLQIIRDSLEYEIKCGEQSSRAWVQIYIRDKPDNIETEVCHVTPPPISFGIDELYRSEKMVNTYSCVLCGDIDGDGTIEMLTMNNKTDGALDIDAIVVFAVNKETGKLDVKYTIQLPAQAVLPFPHGQFAIARVDKDENGTISKYASVFVTTGSGTTKNMLIKYQFNPNKGVNGEYEEAWSQSYSDNTNYSHGVPLLADFAADGNVQIQVYDKIFNAQTGVLLADGGMINSNVNSGTKYGFGWYGHAMRLPPFYATSCVAADIDGDGIPEVIAGDCVYKVTITNHNGTAGNSFTLARRANGTAINADPSRADIVSLYGATALADMDGDGELDVVVAARKVLATSLGEASLYIYNPRNGEILNDNLLTDKIPITINYGPALPMIGDFNGDGQPDIAVNGYKELNSFRYDPQTRQLSLLTQPLATTDVSAATGITLFDFTQNKEAQLVYRDQDNLRIIDGATLNILATIDPVGSPTVNEYPIVADVDGDGHAEIIVVGSDIPGNTTNQQGALRVYGAAGTDKWAPARKVWHQNAFNPLYINDDLTIP
ncbi:MAG: VCBS repeat-containing protein [Candidatus Azobacteroides sp.]|nr:VCBS repeat-containing protein [Candidatus Azobacteroides sp.]